MRINKILEKVKRLGLEIAPFYFGGFGVMPFGFELQFFVDFVFLGLIVFGGGVCLWSGDGK